MVGFLCSAIEGLLIYTAMGPDATLRLRRASLPPLRSTDPTNQLHLSSKAEVFDGQDVQTVKAHVKDAVLLIWQDIRTSPTSWIPISEEC